LRAFGEDQTQVFDSAVLASPTLQSVVIPIKKVFQSQRQALGFIMQCPMRGFGPMFDGNIASQSRATLYKRGCSEWVAPLDQQHWNVDRAGSGDWQVLPEQRAIPIDHCAKRARLPPCFVIARDEIGVWRPRVVSAVCDNRRLLRKTVHES
jgi:hypothetical protein